MLTTTGKTICEKAVDHFSAYQHIERRINNNCSGERQKKYEVDASSPREAEQMSTQKERQEDGMESERTQVLLKQ
jgi:hypothetical protein